MAFIILTIAGVLAVILVKQEWQRKKQFMFIGAFMAAATLVFLVIEIITAKSTGEISKGAVDIMAEVAWVEIGMYFAMVLGMISKYIFDAIGNRKRGRLKLYKWQILKPILVSPIIFAGIYTQLPEKTAPFILILLSFQNGFFWHTLLYKLFPEDEQEKKA